MVPKIDTTFISMECMFTAQARALSSPRYRGGSCAICTGPSSHHYTKIFSRTKIFTSGSPKTI